MKILNIDSLIDLKANESIRKMVEDLKEYIELKFVSLALVNDNYSFFVVAQKYFSGVRLLIQIKTPKYVFMIADIYIDSDFYRNKFAYEFTNYVRKHDMETFDNVEELKKYIDKMIQFYEECFKY